MAGNRLLCHSAAWRTVLTTVPGSGAPSRRMRSASRDVLTPSRSLVATIRSMMAQRRGLSPRAAQAPAPEIAIAMRARGRNFRSGHRNVTAAKQPPRMIVHPRSTYHNPDRVAPASATTIARAPAIMGNPRFAGALNTRHAKGINTRTRGAKTENSRQAKKSAPARPQSRHGVLARTTGDASGPRAAIPRDAARREAGPGSAPASPPDRACAGIRRPRGSCAWGAACPVP